MQQQHLMQMRPMMSGGYYPNNVTTDHIQQYLDENKSLILKIVESQNSGKLSECAENQARLQRNLMYLAAIADSQPQPPAVHNQYPPSGAMQSGAHYAQQQQQAQQMSQQSLMAARSSMLYSQQPYAALQQQALHNSQLGMGSGSTTGLHMMQQQSEASNASGGNGSLGGFPDFGRKHEMGGTDGSSEGRGGGDGGENLYLKTSGDGN